MRRKLIRRLLTFVVITAFGMAAFLIGCDLLQAVRSKLVNDAVRRLYPASTLSFFDAIAVSAEAEGYDDVFQESSSDSNEVTAEDVFQISETPRSEAQTGWEDADTETVPAPPIHTDFITLYETNPDIVGWLSNEKEIDFPVVQRDNEYYLDHNFFNHKDSNGTLFLNPVNDVWPKDRILVIHGHAMRSGQMFGSLRLYKDEQYVREHPLIDFRTIYEEDKRYYVPIAGFDASMEPESRFYFDVLRFDFNSEEEFAAYIDTVLQFSYWHSPVKTDVNDDLLILITCSYLQTNGRFLLVCRELREDETPDEMVRFLNEEAWF